MAKLALLFFAACALAAPLHAASLPGATSELQDKIPAALPEETKQPLETGLEHSHLIEPVKEIDNELRLKPTGDIPVEVVVENIKPSVKLNEVSNDDDIKRPQVDLENPGLPQRQEHETQNPEQHPDEQIRVSTIKENIEQTQILLKQSFQDVSDNIQNWLSNNDDQFKIQQNIQNLRETFTNQVQKLNVTIQAFANPEASEPAESQGDSQRDYQNIESRLKMLEDNFHNGVQTLSAGVNLVASLKSADADDDAAREEAAPAPPAQPATPAPPTATNPPQIVSQFLTALYNGTISGFQNIRDMLIPTSTPPPAVQADQPAGTSGPSTIWEQVQNATINSPIFQLFRPNGNASTPIRNPFEQLFNSTRPTFFNPFAQNGTSSGGSGFFSGLLNLGSTTAKPAEAAAAASSSATGAQPEESKPQSQSPNADTPAEALAVVQPAAQTVAQPVVEPVVQPGGPIRQFLNNSPVVQSITGAVQRLQNTITNVETPRDPAEKSDSKGGWYGGPVRPGGSGDSNDSGLSQQNAEEIKPIQEELKKKTEEVTELKPVVVSEKTE